MSGEVHKADDVAGNRYRILRWIGQGGMQEVYLARDCLLNREVALKTPIVNNSQRRFERSAIVSARVNHNNVAKTLDYFQESGRPYLIEEYISGLDLSNIVGKRLPYLPPQAAAKVLHQLARAVSASHNVQVVHRDLKPSNIMVAGGLRLDRIKVTDFGIAKLAEEELASWAEGDEEVKTATSSRTVLGAIPYMAPESITAFRQAGKAADVWAIGAIIYEMISGRKPFGRGLAAIPSILAAQKPKRPSPLSSLQFSGLGTDILDLVYSCLQFDASLRPTADQLTRDCELLCYDDICYETGSISSIQTSTYGFFQIDGGGDGFYHTDSFYGDRSINLDARIWFARYSSDGSDRAFPIVKMSSL